jgi:4-carboxymuconolactone decarboxylase
MERLKLPTPETMTPEQRTAYDAYVARLGRPPVGPAWVWLTIPALFEATSALGLHVSQNLGLPKRLKEIAVLVTARRWDAQYEWYAHERMAAAAGVEAGIIDAIRQRRKPPLTAVADELVYDFAVALTERGRVGDDLYGRVAAHLGEAQLVELTTVLGLYAMVSLTLNAFEFPIPADGTPLPA